LCPRGANFSLQLSLRRMNQHIRKCHGEQGYLSSEKFITLEGVQAVQNGIKNSYVEKRELPLVNDFRSEGTFEETVGLLKTSIYFDGEEEACVPDSSWFIDSKNTEQKAVWDKIFTDVVTLFARADVLCRQIGSTMVRHQVMRDHENRVSCKVFHPVTESTAKRYARHVSSCTFIFMRYVGFKCHIVSVRYVNSIVTLHQVTDFVFFCAKRQSAARIDILALLSEVLFEASVSITQTFMAR
jgi:hypothetical protein